MGVCYSQAQWDKAIEAFHASGLRINEFHKNHISDFFPDPVPSHWTFRRKILQSKASLKITPIVEVIDLTSSEEKPAEKIWDSGCEREVEMELPDGTSLRFSTEDPEKFALSLWKLQRSQA